jgi:uncharacterized protein DUF1840
MLVTFTCSAYADITLFGDIAVRLLRLMGHSGTVPGAIMAEDIPNALQRLQTAIEDQPQSGEPDQDHEDDDDQEPPVSLAHRAVPLIALLQAAADANTNVMWERSDSLDLIK